MAKREGCEDYVPSLDFAEPMPGDDPKAIAAFVKVIRESIEKGTGEAETSSPVQTTVKALQDGIKKAGEAPAGTQPKEPEESPPTSQRGLWTSCFLVLAAVGVWFYYGPLAGLACLAPVAVLEAYRVFRTAYRTRMELTPQEEEFIAALSRGEEVKQ